MLTKAPPEQLIVSISEILVNNGLKSTTMDTIAATLSISKRTLYEYFGSKKDMIFKVMGYWLERRTRLTEKIINEASNVMEGLIKVFDNQQKMINDVNVKFYREMDKFYPDIRRMLDGESDQWVKKIMVIINKGVEQGVFRPDVNYPVILSLKRIQMESLKRMQEVFPPNITMEEAMATINISFLRSIASPTGMEILDRLTSNSI
ncbi:MAG: TetR/AcrR family transcriptional regulator [Muribaculaceae bacterium]|nr:TetR/AcrR family transcriptional regulator [Muribaculaceae bacterium]MDE6866904.1 TetR/AcrR family transcriptional regulator [Muribaculaceae bacterium]